MPDPAVPPMNARPDDAAGRAQQAMREAVREARTDELAHLLQLPEVDVNRPDEAGQTALVEAIGLSSDRRRAVVDRLLDSPNIDLRQPGLNQREPVQAAFAIGAWKVLKRLLEDPRLESAPSVRGQLERDLFRMIGNQENLRLFCYLFVKEPEAAEFFSAARDEKQRTPLLLAAELGLTALLRALLACESADACAVDERGNNALHGAAANGHARCVTFLLADGRIDMNARNAKGRSPLDRAKRQGRDITVAQLHARAASRAVPAFPPARPDRGADADGRLTFLTVLRSGGEYLPEHAERLCRQIALHYTLPHRFYCLSDKPLGCPWVPLEPDRPGGRSKLELFRHDFGPTVYFDLDITINGNLDWLVDAPKQFSMLADFYVSDGLNSGMMAWTGDRYRHLADRFTPEDAARHAERPQGDDGAWIRERVADATSLQERFPGKIASYKKSGYAYPKDAAVVCFHGIPRPWEVAPPPSGSG